jgi:acetyltransferase
MELPTTPGVPLPQALVPPDYPRELERHLRLADGDDYAFRPVVPADQPAMKASLSLADPQTLYQRFFTTQPKLDDKTLSHLTHVDYQQRLAIVAMAAQSVPVAIARYEADAERAQAEVSFLVAPPWRRIGLGLALARLLEEAARARGIRVLRAFYLADNEPVARLFERWGFASPRIIEGIAEIEKRLD